MLILHLLLVMIIGYSRASKPLTEDPSNCDTMMLLLRVFLLVMLIGGPLALKTKTPISNCDTMSCFVPKICDKENAGTNSPLVPVGAIDEVFNDCNSIAKIRSYSIKYYLIILESYDPQQISIQLTQGTTIFDCSKDQNEVVSAKYTYKLAGDLKDVPMIESNANPLLCKFFVRNDAGDVFADRTVDVKLSGQINPYGSVMKGAIFHTICETTCDPDAVQTKTVGKDDDKTVYKFNVKIADLFCPVGQLKYRKDDVSTFEIADAISCPANQFVISGQPITLKEARCEVTTCTMCNSLTFPSTLKSITEGKCTKLKCKNDGRIKIDSSDPIDGSVECEYVKPNHVWQINGQTITESSPVTCAEKKTCDAEAKEICSACPVVGGIPMCDGGTFKWKGLLVYNFTCNENTGQVEMNIQGEQRSFGKKDVEGIQCVDKDGKERRVNGTEIASASTGGGDGLLYGGIGAVVVVLLVVGAIVGFVFWRRTQQKKQARPQFPIPAKPDAKSVTSKESKSNQSQKPSESNKDTPKPNEERPAQPVAGLDAPKGGEMKSPADVAILEAYYKEQQEKMGKNGDEEQSAPDNDSNAVGMLKNANGDYTAANKNKN